jgi:hypothetical protein
MDRRRNTARDLAEFALAHRIVSFTTSREIGSCHSFREAVELLIGYLMATYKVDEPDEPLFQSETEAREYLGRFGIVVDW